MHKCDRIRDNICAIYYTYMYNICCIKHMKFYTIHYSNTISTLKKRLSDSRTKRNLKKINLNNPNFE